MKPFSKTQSQKQDSTEEKLKESEERYWNLLNRVPDGVYRSTSDGKFLMVNKAMIKMLGYENEEELLKLDIPTDLYFSPLERLAAQQNFTQTANHPCIFRLKMKDGSELWVEDGDNREFDEEGNLLYYEGVLRDITRRKQAEQALSESEKMFRDLFDNAPDMYIIFNSAGIIQDFNLKGVEKLGYAKREIIGKPVKELIHPDDILVCKNMFSSILNGQNKSCNVEVRLLHKNRTPIWFSNACSSQLSEDGHVETVKVVCRDITEKKKLEAELARSQRLETAGQIAAQIAHDFNNLLAPLTAYPNILREDLAHGVNVDGLIDEIETAAQKIAEINQQLLALGRRGHYTMELINLNELLEKVLFSISFSSEIIVETDFESELFLINGGEAQLIRALVNVINNAKEAMQFKGTVTLKTENIYLDEPFRSYQLVKPGEYVKLTITDEGSGISPEAWDKIFEPFFTTKRMDKLRGSGLGLSIVHGIIQDHNGYIAVESEVDKGTSFSFYFPISREKQKPVEIKDSQDFKGDEKVLIIDDDPIQLKVCDEILTRIGYVVNKVESGERAVQLMQETAYDLVVLDMVMGGIDGAETYRQILEIYPTQKAIILSGYAMSRRIEHTLKMGASMFVSKPIQFDSLASAVRKTLDGKTQSVHEKVPETAN